MIQLLWCAFSCGVLSGGSIGWIAARIYTERKLAPPIDAPEDLYPTKIRGTLRALRRMREEDSANKETARYRGDV